MITPEEYEEAKEVALFRYSVLSGIINGEFDLKTKPASEYYREAASKVYRFRGEECSYSASTIKNWHGLYKAGGLEALFPKPRTDKGKPRRLDDDCKEFIDEMINKFPTMPCTEIFRRMTEANLIIEKSPSLSTVTRYVKQQAINPEVGEKTDMRRYERAHINEVWYGDTLHGPYLRINGVSKKTYMIAFIDDASRFVVGAKFFFEENYKNVISVIQNAVSKYGCPVRQYGVCNIAGWESQSGKVEQTACTQP